MHLFNAGQLANELRANALSETEKYRYLLSLVVLRMLSEAGRSATAQPKNLFANLALVALLSLMGFHICHKVNQRGDNQKLIERLICLSVPVSIWVYLLTFVVYYGGFIATQSVLGRAQALSTWAALGSAPISISNVFLLIHFGVLIYFIAQIARPQATTPPAPLAAP